MPFQGKLFWIVLFFCCTSLFAEIHPIAISYSHTSQPIGLQCEYFLDETNTVSIEDLLGPETRHRFVPSAEEILNFGPTLKSCWIRFSYSNLDTLKHFLEIGNSNLNEIDFYVVDAHAIIQSRKAGLARTEPDGALKLNVWLFELPYASSGKNYSVYLRIADQRRVIVPLAITDLNSSISEAHKTDFLFGIYFGAGTIIAIINIFIFLYFRESLYLYYSLHILSQLLINGILKGYLLSLFGSAFYFLSPYVPGIAGISNIFFILFSLVFLDVRQHFPKLYRLSLGLIALPAINTAFNLLGRYTLSAVAGTYIGIVVCVWLFILGLMMYRQRVKQARFFVIGWGAFFLGILILNFALNGWIPITSFTSNAAVFGTLFEVLLISSALADRINLLRVNHNRERQERILLIEKQNTWLEENVRLRTNELIGKNSEIEAQNEELKQQHEELSTTHELVEKQKRLVEEQNQKIENINHGLEIKVQERTLQLEGTVKSLIRQNHDLEQFSYIVSHNMRAPVARILGLLQLLDLEKGSEHDRKVVLAHLNESANGIDQIIHDLSQIIAIRKGLDTIVEKIDLEQILKHNQSDLTDEIRKAAAQIIVDVRIKELVSVKGYIQSILYNLLSNAIKYRDPERKSIIQIAVFEENGQVIFEVRDNGLGIDLPRERMNEIFNLYKRLHTHVQGKGLGLYLVKSQVDGLHGHIDVESLPGVGTTFTVFIPKN